MQTNDKSPIKKSLQPIRQGGFCFNKVGGCGGHGRATAGAGKRREIGWSALGVEDADLPLSVSGSGRAVEVVAGLG